MRLPSTHLATLGLGVIFFSLGTGLILHAQDDDGGTSITTVGAGTLVLDGPETYTGDIFSSYSGSTYIEGGSLSILPTTGGGPSTITIGSASGSFSTTNVLEISPSDTTVLTTADAPTLSSDGSNAVLSVSTGAPGSPPVTLSGSLLPITSSVEIVSTNPVALSTSLDFFVGQSLYVDINSSTMAASTVNLTGSIALDDTNLVITDMSSSPDTLPVGSTFDLVKYTGTETGEFEVDGGLIPNGGTFDLGGNTFQIDYAYGDPEIIITKVDAAPEPSTWFMLAGGLIALAFWRRFAPQS